jgi:ubiquinol-cytochrome c reductase cytochrome c subunit
VNITHTAAILAVAALLPGLAPAVGRAASQPAAVAAQAPVAPAGPAAPQGDPDKGKATFARVGCYECHGREAQGSPYTGPRLGPNPIPWAALSKYVRSPKGDMPPYKPQVLPDSDLADIYAFLRTRARPASIDSYFEP